MTTELLAAIALLLLANLALTLWLLLRPRPVQSPEFSLDPILQNEKESQERTERVLHEEIARNRAESGEGIRQLRDGLNVSLNTFGQQLAGQLRDIAARHKEQLDGFANQLAILSRSNETKLETVRQTVEAGLAKLAQDAVDNAAKSRAEDKINFDAFCQQQKQELITFQSALKILTDSTGLSLTGVRETLEQKLNQMQTDNAAKLEQMRATVDEKLHATLETRLGESFKLVSERLELVHKGLGEMQTLANGVGDLKKVLTNIKTRGTWGEVALGNLLEQLFTPDQYASNVNVNEQNLERVEYAIKLPGRDGTDKCVWLPIDAKFPEADYQRLAEAADAGDAQTVAACAQSLEAQIVFEAGKISEKYINPPNTTDFAILFLPTEGLFAEVLRRPGLSNRLLIEHRVVLTGPTTLSALLTSLQVGFRTLAIEKRSSEVWQVLGSVKTEFSRFGEVLDKVHKKLQEATHTVETAQTRKRAVERKLRGVEQTPKDDQPLLLPQTIESSEV